MDAQQPTHQPTDPLTDSDPYGSRGRTGQVEAWRR